MVVRELINLGSKSITLPCLIVSLPPPLNYVRGFWRVISIFKVYFNYENESDCKYFDCAKLGKTRPPLPLFKNISPKSLKFF